MREFERALPVAIEATGRVVEGVALTYDRAYRVSDDGGRTFYHEGWRAGAFVDGLAEVNNTVEARVDHRDRRVGLAAFVDSSAALRFTVSADRTPLGDALLEHVDAGHVREVSLRFESDRQATRDGVVWRLRARPRELSFVVDADRAQYDDALVTARRAFEADPVEVAATARRAAATAALLERTRTNLAAGARLL